MSSAHHPLLTQRCCHRADPDPDPDPVGTVRAGAQPPGVSSPNAMHRRTHQVNKQLYLPLTASIFLHS